MTDDIIARLRSLLEKAPARPWEACDKGDYGDFDGESRVLSNNDQRIAVFHHGGCEENQAECDAAIELTAEIVNALPALLLELETSRKLLKEAEEVVGDARGALHQHYVDWDGEPEDAVPLQLARSRCDAFLQKLKGEV